jgi:hypothetical protein
MNTELTRKNGTGTVAQTLTEKCLTPLWWLAIGYAFGFFHGNSRKKKKIAAD